MTQDAQCMEQTLKALADKDDPLRIELFDRFFQEFPARRADFIAFEASSRRMTDETLQLLYAHATGAHWLWTQTADLVDLHRAYGAIPDREFDRFIHLTAQTVCDLAQASAAEREAWNRQADSLQRLVRKARADWEIAFPR